MRQHLDMRIETAAIYCLFTVLPQKWNDLWNGVLLIAYERKAADIYISWVYALLFQKQEREIQSEEENQQEEICQEMQGNA